MAKTIVPQRMKKQNVSFLKSALSMRIFCRKISNLNITKCISVLLFVICVPLSSCASSRVDQTVRTMSGRGGSLYSPSHYLTPDRNKELQEISAELGEPLTPRGKAFVYSAIFDINKSYGEYIDVLTAGRASVNVFYDSLNLGLTGAATALNPVGTKTILAGLSTFFQGQKASVDKNIFDDKAIFALSSIMEVRRSQTLTTISTKLKADNNYNLGEALMDLDSLYKAGSLQTALQAAFLNQPAVSHSGTTAPPELDERVVPSVGDGPLLPSTVTPVE